MAKLSLDCCGVEQALKPNQQATYLRCIAQDSTFDGSPARWNSIHAEVRCPGERPASL